MDFLTGYTHLITVGIKSAVIYFNKPPTWFLFNLHRAQNNNINFLGKTNGARSHNNAIFTYLKVSPQIKQLGLVLKANKKSQSHLYTCLKSGLVYLL